jgi:hypothetical protein
MRSSSDLVRLSDLKLWLGISGDDDDLVLKQLIAQTSRAILAYLGRPTLLPEIYIERYDVCGQSSLLLRQWPVISIEACSINGVTVQISAADGAGGFECMLEPAEDFPPGKMQRVWTTANTFSGRLRNVHIRYRAGYQISDELATIPLSEPYEITVVAPHGYCSSDEQVAEANSVGFITVKDNPGTGEYVSADGLYSFSSLDAGRSINISYGYIPADVTRCCIDWVADQYQYRTRIGQHTKSLGGQESVSFIVKDMPDLTKCVLQPYRRVATP